MTQLRQARIEDAAEVAELLARCEAADGFAPLSEFKALRVPIAEAVRTVVVAADDGLVATGAAAWHPASAGEADGYWAAEIAVDPSHRSTKVYREVLNALVAEVGAAVSFWTFSDEQRIAARATGMTEVRALLLLERPLPAKSMPLPDGMEARPFVVGADESAWLALNQRVFADHPEAAAIDESDLELRMAQPWFDPAGFLLLTDGEALLGYCWTKRHSIATGEIYMIGLIPESRGKGLARPLTSAGLDHLSRSGASRTILYAEATNHAALRLYESMGFVMARRIALFEHLGEAALS